MLRQVKVDDATQAPTVQGIRFRNVEDGPRFSGGHKLCLCLPSGPCLKKRNHKSRMSTVVKIRTRAWPLPCSPFHICREKAMGKQKTKTTPQWGSVRFGWQKQVDGAGCGCGLVPVISQHPQALMVCPTDWCMPSV